MSLEAQPSSPSSGSTGSTVRVATAANIPTSAAMASPSALVSLESCDSGSSAQGERVAGQMSQSHVSFIRFNQDVTSLALSTPIGYKLFSLASIDNLECVHATEISFANQVLIIERLFSSSLVAMVQRSAPRKLKVCHFKKGTEICNYSYSSQILSIRLNRARLIVSLESSIYVHNIRDMKILHTIKDSPPNPKGLCALSINSEKCFLAYPGSSSIGEVQLFDAFNLQAKGMINAHESPLAALAFNSDCTRLATASEKGTVIRVFDVENGAKFAEFRRGVKRCAMVGSLSFSGDGHYLVLGSNTETIHVFRLEDAEKAVTSAAAAVTPKKEDTARLEKDDSWMGYFSNAVNLTANYLPTQVTEALNQTRAFATITIPKPLPDATAIASGSAAGEPPVIRYPNQVAVTSISKKTRVLLATSDGYLYIYDLPVGPEGGECTMVKQHCISLDFSRQSEDDPEHLKATSHDEGSTFSQKHGRSMADEFGDLKRSSGPSRCVEAGKFQGEECRDKDFVEGHDIESSGGPAVLNVARQQSSPNYSDDSSPPPQAHLP